MRLLPSFVCLSVWCTGEAPFCVDALPIVQRIIRGEHAQAGKRELRKFVLLFFEPLYCPLHGAFSAIFVSVVCGNVEDYRYGRPDAELSRHDGKNETFVFYLLKRANQSNFVDWSVFPSSR